MKHLKVFELFTDDIKIGDYVLVISEFNDLDEEIMIIKGKIDFTYACEFLNPEKYKFPVVKIYQDEIIKILTPIEVDALKFNL